MDRQQEFVLRTLEERDIRFVRLWFTDVLGTLKSVSVAPAELEAAFGAEDLTALAERFGAGRLKARDLARIIGAGLRGAGEAISDEEVARLPVDGGAAG